MHVFCNFGGWSADLSCGRTIGPLCSGKSGVYPLQRSAHMRAIVSALRNREDGFTLIELMVVILIIAILIAVAIPTFLGFRERAQDRAAQSELRTALTTAKAIYLDNQDY